ncbi:MAG TPA: peptidylprolyl isomerase [Kofleriaceae bacterium]|nr:peptidylprolyl isomerase [Kofleriaceae bacterium]
MIRLGLVCALLVACGPGVKGGPTMSNKIGSSTMQPVTSSVVSADILSREPVANTAQVKHILISWKDLEDEFQGHQDARAQKRTKADAEAEVKQLMDRLKAGEDFDKLMKAHSEDLGSAASGRAFTVTPDAQLVIEFRQLSLRLNVNEIGVVQSQFGFHIIKRLE